MNEWFQKEKLEYEDIEVPDELLLLVRRTVAEDRRKKAMKRRNYMIRMASSVAAMVLLCLGIGVNSSYTFAKTAAKMPVVNTVANAMIVRSYKAEVITAAEEEIEEKKRQKQQKQEEKQKQKQQKQQEQETQQKQETEESVQKEGGQQADTTISNNNAVNQEETAPSEKNEEASQGLEAWISGLTIEDLKAAAELYTPDMEERYAKAPEKLRTILLAELPEKDISLYGYHENNAYKGVALRVGGNFRCFDWVYMDESKKLPRLFCVDADGNGKEELAIMLYNQEVLREEIPERNLPEPEGDAGAASGQPKREQGEAIEKPENVSEESAGKTAEGSGAKAEEQKTAEGGGAKAEEQKTTEGSDAEEADMAETAKDVYGNDTGLSQEQPEEKIYECTGELLIVSFEGENWKVGNFSVKDQESQILSQLKADYDEEKRALQLYLMEEPFGGQIVLGEMQGMYNPGEEDRKFVYKKLRPVLKECFAAGDGLSLCFAVDAVFQDGEGKNRYLKLEPELEADVSLDGDSVTIKNLRVKGQIPEEKTPEGKSGTSETAGKK